MITFAPLPWGNQREVMCERVWEVSAVRFQACSEPKTVQKIRFFFFRLREKHKMLMPAST